MKIAPSVTKSPHQDRGSCYLPMKMRERGSKNSEGRKVKILALLGKNNPFLYKIEIGSSRPRAKIYIKPTIYKIKVWFSDDFTGYKMETLRRIRLKLHNSFSLKKIKPRQWITHLSSGTLHNCQKQLKDKQPKGKKTIEKKRKEKNKRKKE